MEKGKNNSSKIAKVFSEEEAKSYETWRMPMVDDTNVSVSDGQGSTKYLTAEQLERIQKQAYDAAYAKAKAQGLLDGENIIKQRVAHLEAIGKILENPLLQLNDEVQQEIVHLCIALLKQLVRRELKLDPGQVVAIVRDALSALPLASRNVQIRTHPEDAAIIESALGLNGTEKRWLLVADPTISRGGCKIISETSRIDSTIEARIAQLITHVFGGERETDRHA